MFNETISASLLQNSDQLNNCVDDYDVNIQIGEGSNSEIFKAHSNILRIRSTYFNTALSSYWAKKEGNIFIFNKPNIKPDILRIILKFIYTGTISLDENMDKLDELLNTADEIELIDELIDCFHEHFTELSNKENIILLFNALNMISSYDQRGYDIISNYISKNALKFFNDSNLFLNLLIDNSLISLIKNDYFNMKEIDIWNNLIKWAIAKNPTVSSHTSNWKSKEVEIIKHTIQNFIPHVRFFQIPPDDYYEKVHSLSALLPSILEKEINLYFIDPEIPISTKILQPRISIDSLIIKGDHIYHIDCWIDNKLDEVSNSLKSLKYKFNLLLRGSRDGFGVETFKEKCYKKGATIVIIKLESKDEIIGGYNPLKWSGSDKYLVTCYSFIFSFKSIIDSSNPILSRVKNKEYAIYDSKNDKLGFSYDLQCTHRGKIISCTQIDYERNIISLGIFNIENYEVFQVKQI